MHKHSARILLVVALFAACKQHNDNAGLKMLSQGLTNSNEHIAASNFILYREYEEKSTDPMFATFNLKWFPKSQKIKEYTVQIIREIDLQLEKNTLQVQLQQNDLYNKLLDYKHNLINVLGPSEIPVLPLDNDITDTSMIKKQQFDSLLNNSNSSMQRAILNKIKNDILLSEYKLLFYGLASTSQPPVHYEERSLIAALNSSYFKSGDTMELMAGMGRFSAKDSPRIIVNDKEIPVKHYGRTNHFLPVTGKPGKYILKVKLEYTKPDGTIEYAIKNLSYTILP